MVNEIHWGILSLALWLNVLLRTQEFSNQWAEHLQLALLRPMAVVATWIHSRNICLWKYPLCYFQTLSSKAASRTFPPGHRVTHIYAELSPGLKCTSSQWGEARFPARNAPMTLVSLKQSEQACKIRWSHSLQAREHECKGGTSDQFWRFVPFQTARTLTSVLDQLWKVEHFLAQHEYLAMHETLCTLLTLFRSAGPFLTVLGHTITISSWLNH